MNGNFSILSQVNNCEARRKRAVSDPPPTITFSAVQNSSGIHDNDNGLLFRSFKFVFFYFLLKHLTKIILILATRIKLYRIVSVSIQGWWRIKDKTLYA